MLQQYDPKNKDLQIWIKDRLFHRDVAKISVFDSVVQGGDAVWEGLRLYDGSILHLDKHLNRMYESAKALAFVDIPTEHFIKSALAQTVKANNMHHDVHIRMTLTRGEKITSGMDPRLNQNGSCLIILAEHKPLVYDNDHGITVITSAIRRNNPAFLDSKIHHNNLLNNIQAKIQANVAGKDAALMLDMNGFAAELNGSNIFIVKNGIIYTPFADACLHGITREFVMEVAKNNNIPCQEKNLSIVEIYNADELFCTGTWGELTPIIEVDNRKIENRSGQNILTQLNKMLKQAIPKHCEPMI